jgi:hypothetical protein
MIKTFSLEREQKDLTLSELAIRQLHPLTWTINRAYSAANFPLNPFFFPTFTFASVTYTPLYDTYIHGYSFSAYTDNGAGMGSVEVSLNSTPVYGLYGVTGSIDTQISNDLVLYHKSLKTPRGSDVGTLFRNQDSLMLYPYNHYIPKGSPIYIFWGLEATVGRSLIASITLHVIQPSYRGS